MIYHSGYYFTDSHTDANLASTTGYIKDKAYLAVVTSYDEESGIATLSQRNKMCEGDQIEILTPGMVGRGAVASEMYDENGERISSTPHPYMTFKMKAPFVLRRGDIVRLAD